jgi:hypothetical protein
VISFFLFYLSSCLSTSPANTSRPVVFQLPRKRILITQAYLCRRELCSEGCQQSKQQGSFDHLCRHFTCHRVRLHHRWGLHTCFCSLCCWHEVLSDFEEGPTVFISHWVPWTTGAALPTHHHFCFSSVFWNSWELCWNVSCFCFCECVALESGSCSTVTSAYGFLLWHHGGRHEQRDTGGSCLLWPAFHLQDERTVPLSEPSESEVAWEPSTGALVTFVMFGVCVILFIYLFTWEDWFAAVVDTQQNYEVGTEICNVLPAPTASPLSTSYIFIWCIDVCICVFIILCVRVCMWERERTEL